VGFAGDKKTGGAMFKLNFSFPIKNKLFMSIRYSTIAEFQMFNAVSPNENRSELAPMVGYFYQTKMFFASATAGISIAYGTKRLNLISHSYGGWLFGGTDYYTADDYVTVGIPIEAQVKFLPFKWFGLGIGGFSDINFKRADYGFFFGFHFGKF
jgi:hypothetical protein